jgi:ABC-type Fe3+/spermidine/putrescine transport system ATPase subunit
LQRTPSRPVSTTSPAWDRPPASESGVEGPSETVLRLDDVSKIFGATRAVDRIQLDVKRGEFFTLLGPSGCGKTTTLRMVAGLEQPDEGEIWLRGRTVASAPRHRFLPPDKRNLGMVFQSYAIWPHMSVFENVAYPLRLRGWKSGLIREKVASVLNLVGLTGFEDRAATLLSGGQQQRLALCRSLVYEPDVLLLDEPFSNLDAKLREQMRVELKLLHRRLDVTVLFVTHDQLEALSLSDTIAVMNVGQVEQIGSPQALYEHPRSAFVRDFLGQTILLEGHVEALHDGAATVVLAPELGRDALVGHIAPGAPLSTGQAVTLAIRPEEVEVASGDETGTGTVTPNRLEAIVEAALFVGDHYQVSVSLGDRALLVPMSRVRRWQPGQRLELVLPPERVTVWPT